MQSTGSIKINSLLLLTQKVKDYALLFKLRLSVTVVFSSIIAYSIATINEIYLAELLYLFLGGFLITAGSNAINEILEKDYDKLMNRTKKRPVADNRMGVPEAALMAGLCGVSGIVILWYFFNPISALLGAIALFSYAFIYTPLKRITPFAVLVGAVPGAMPPLIGWICATGAFSFEALVLVSIQFLWQFPHFWAIAWVSHDDYARAGFKLLPSSGRDKNTALLSILYILILIPVSLIPFHLGLTGIPASSIIIISGILFLWPAVKLYRSGELKDAKKLMFSSIIYLPVVLIALLTGRIF